MSSPENFRQAIGVFENIQPGNKTLGNSREITLADGGLLTVNADMINNQSCWIKVGSSLQDGIAMSFHMNIKLDKDGHFAGFERDEFYAWVVLGKEKFLLTYAEPSDDRATAVLSEIEKYLPNEVNCTAPLEFEEEARIRRELITAGCPEVVLTELTALRYLDPELIAEQIPEWLFITPDTPPTLSLDIAD